MFSGGGIAETYFGDVGINVAVANELLPDRARFYKENHKSTEMICGDITDKKVFDKVINDSKKANVSFILATPPCQGMSTLGLRQYEKDKRNFLVKYVLEAIDALDPDFVMIENVPTFLDLLFEYDGKRIGIVEELKEKYGSKYEIGTRVLNAKDFGVPQSRPRAIIKMHKASFNWPWPKEESVITLRQAIGDLPSLEAGQDSGIKWHKALPINNPFQIEALKHTPEGQSALRNPVYYPKKKNGQRVKGFHNTYTRMRWDEPAPARTTNNQLISGHNNVHPGKLLPNGTWSDARALTLRELIIVSSLPLDWKIPKDYKESFVRQLIGEAVPPLLTMKIVEQIGK